MSWWYWPMKYINRDTDSVLGKYFCSVIQYHPLSDDTAACDREKRNIWVDGWCLGQWCPTELTIQQKQCHFICHFMSLNDVTINMTYLAAIVMRYIYTVKWFLCTTLWYFILHCDINFVQYNPKLYRVSWYLCIALIYLYTVFV